MLAYEALDQHGRTSTPSRLWIWLASFGTWKLRVRNISWDEWHDINTKIWSIIVSHPSPDATPIVRHTTHARFGNWSLMPAPSVAFFLLGVCDFGLCFWQWHDTIQYNVQYYMLYAQGIKHGRHHKDHSSSRGIEEKRQSFDIWIQIEWFFLELSRHPFPRSRVYLKGNVIVLLLVSRLESAACLVHT